MKKETSIVTEAIVNPSPPTTLAMPYTLARNWHTSGDTSSEAATSLEGTSVEG